MTPTSGTTLSGRYTLTERIASGGMGEVWQARDGILERTVAVKVLHPNVNADPQFAQRFRDEARHSASLSHPNIATVYDYGEDAGTAYLVMELVPGTPLSHLIATRGALGATMTRSVLGQAALALAAAHEAGVVHRDVKPGNIIVTPEGTAKLTDFGIARAVDSSVQTRTGEVMGTPHYISPEQALGQPATGASDLYALGIVGYEMLTGRRPFDAGSAVATALSQVNDEVPPLPPDVPADVRSVVERCLSKDPAVRPRSAAAVAASLGFTVAGLAGAIGALDVSDPSGTAVIAAPTAVLGAPTTAAGAATGALPVDEGDAEDEGTRISPWWILPAVLVLALVGWLIYSSLTGGSTPTSPATTVITTTPSTSTTSSTTSIPTTTETPTSTSAAPQLVNVDLGAYLGRQASEVIPELQALPVRVRTQDFVTDQYPDGSVVNITPSGEIPRGDTVLVSVAVAPPTSSTTSTPASAPTTPSAATGTATGP